jgi:hypothetical protein
VEGDRNRSTVHSIAAGTERLTLDESVVLAVHHDLSASALGNPVRDGADDERLPLLALRIEVLRIVVDSEAVLTALDLD